MVHLAYLFLIKLLVLVTLHIRNIASLTMLIVGGGISGKGVY